VVDRGILGKLEVALGQQKSAQACLKVFNYAPSKEQPFSVLLDSKTGLPFLFIHR
jgi:hypothetical protein